MNMNRSKSLRIEAIKLGVAVKAERADSKNKEAIMDCTYVVELLVLIGCMLVLALVTSLVQY